MSLMRFLKKVISNKTVQLLTISTATVSVGACTYGDLDIHFDTSCCSDNEEYLTIYEQACYANNRVGGMSECYKDAGKLDAEVGIRCCASYDKSGKYLLNEENKEFKDCVDQVHMSPKFKTTEYNEGVHYDVTLLKIEDGPLTSEELESCTSDEAQK